MGVMESVKKGFSVTFRNLPLVALLFVFGAIWNIVQLKLAPAATAAANTPPSPLAIVAGIVFVLVSIFMQGGTLGFVYEAVKQGASNFSTFTNAGGKYYIRLFLAGILIGMVVGVFILLSFLAFSYLARIQTVLGVVVAVILGLIGIYVVLLMFLSPYIIVADNAKVVESIKKSISLAKRNFMKILCAALLLVAIGFLAGLLLGILIGAVSLAGQGTILKLVTVLTGSLVNALLGILVTATFTALYLGLPQE